MDVRGLCQYLSIAFVVEVIDCSINRSNRIKPKQIKANQVTLTWRHKLEANWHVQMPTAAELAETRLLMRGTVESPTVSKHCSSISNHSNDYRRYNEA